MNKINYCQHCGQKIRKPKEYKQIEILEVQQFKRDGDFSSLIGLMQVIPDPSIEYGFKKTIANRIFVNINQYGWFKKITTTKMMKELSELKEKDI
jgi:hypothetical protein